MPPAFALSQDQTLQLRVSLDAALEGPRCIHSVSLPWRSRWNFGNGHTGSNTRRQQEAFLLEFSDITTISGIRQGRLPAVIVSLESDENWHHKDVRGFRRETETRGIPSNRRV